MQKINSILLLALGFSILNLDAFNQKECALNQAMRKLWTDHVVWTHEYIEAAADERANLKLITDRLLKNQDDIGNAIAQFYGKKAGSTLTKLLKEHILIAADLITAAKAGNKIEIAKTNKKWHDNANELADFLSGANKNWPLQEMKNMLYEHLAITLKEATARLQKKWADEIKYYDLALKQILEMADDLTDGIVKQFPRKFRMS